MSEENRRRVRVVLRTQQTLRSSQLPELPGDNTSHYNKSYASTGPEMPAFGNELNCDKEEVTLIEASACRTMPPVTRSRGSGLTPTIGSQPKSHLETESQEINAAVTASLQSWMERYVEERLTAERTKRNQDVEFWREQLAKSEEREKRTAEKSTDDSIKSQWETMVSYNIRNIVYMLRGYDLKDGEAVLWELQTKLPEASFDNIPMEALQDTFESFLGAYIWKFVYTDILSGEGCQWRCNVIRYIQAAKRDIISNEEDPERRAGLASWFSEGAQETKLQVNPELQQTMIDMFMYSLLWMFQTHPRNDHEQQQLKSIISDIVHDATELAIMFMSSKALLIPDWPFYEPYGRCWDISEFDTQILTEHETCAWGMVIRPALEKYGNADGEKHDVSRVLCKPALVQIRKAESV